MIRVPGATTRDLRTVKPGQAVRASDHNALVSAIRSIRGELGRVDQAVLAAALAGLAPGRVLLGEIVAVTPGDAHTVALFPDGGPPPPPDGWQPGDPIWYGPGDIRPPITYTVQALDRTEVRVENAVPAIGRPVRFNQARIYSARPRGVTLPGAPAPTPLGDICLLVRRNDDEGEATVALWVLTETMALRPC